MREQLHHGEDIVKTGIEVPSQSNKDAQHMHKDCQGGSINVDSSDPSPAATIADQELESQPSVGEAIQNGSCNDVKKTGGFHPQFDLPVNSAGMFLSLSPRYVKDECEYFVL